MISSLWHRLTKGKKPELLDSADIAKIFNCSDVEIDHVLEEYGYQQDIGGYWVKTHAILQPMFRQSAKVLIIVHR